ncbi:MAG: protein TolQ [Myxococcales bacterium]|nr:protein TolQ [Myxococcales bacterium]
MTNAITATLATGGGTGQELDIFKLLLGASGVVMGVLVLLVFFSLVSWYIIGYKYFYLRRATSETHKFLDTFWNSKRLDAIYQTAEELRRSPVSQVFKAGYVELSKIKKSEGDRGTWLGDMQSIERALERAQTSELTHLESMIPFLATTGSAAPFVGLFGTVWGIMNSFRSIGAKGAANLSTVAPGIAEALIATAIGLMAAIPAVIAYNYFLRKVKVLHAEMEGFESDFLNIVKRHFFK